MRYTEINQKAADKAKATIQELEESEPKIVQGWSEEGEWFDIMKGDEKISRHYTDAAAKAKIRRLRQKTNEDEIVGGTQTVRSQKLIKFIDKHAATWAREIARYTRKSDLQLSHEEWIDQISKEVLDGDEFNELNFKYPVAWDNMVTAWNSMPEYYANIVWAELINRYSKFKHYKVTENQETLNPPSIDVGDEVKVGKFRNSKATVKGFKKDDHNQPVLKTNKGDKKLFSLRLSKLQQEDAPPGREKQVKALKGKVDNPYAVAWASYNKSKNK